MRKYLSLLFLFILLSLLFYINSSRLDRAIEALKNGYRKSSVSVMRFSFQNFDVLKTWEEKKLARESTNYTISEYMGKKAVKAVSQNSASALFMRKNMDPEIWSRVSWDWAVDKFPDIKGAEILHSKADFDFAAQFYVVFQAKHFLNARAIQYVWTKEIPPGTVSDSPYTKNVKILVLESGPSEGWKHEERDIREDYKNLFGEELRKEVGAISFMTDSDSTSSSAIAYFGDIEIRLMDHEQGMSFKGWKDRLNGVVWALMGSIINKNLKGGNN